MVKAQSLPISYFLLEMDRAFLLSILYLARREKMEGKVTLCACLAEVAYRLVELPQERIPHPCVFYAQRIC